MTAPQPILEARGLGFVVSGLQVLRDVDLSVRAGEMTALVGHNGSGKSTLVKLLARQQPPTTGSILLEGEPVSALASRRFAQRVAYLPQDLTAASGMTVRELVNCGRYPWHGALGRFTPEDADRVTAAIASTRLDSLAGRMVDTMSGGERQRAWIAMLLAQDARCLLLDEPISALDITHQIETLTLLRELARGKSLAVLLVLHDINMAARFCDTINALKSGSIVASGTPQEIMTPTVLHRIYGLEMNVMPHPTRNVPFAYVA